MSSTPCRTWCSGLRQRFNVTDGWLGSKHQLHVESHQGSEDQVFTHALTEAQVWIWMKFQSYFSHSCTYMPIELWHCEKVQHTTYSKVLRNHFYILQQNDEHWMDLDSLYCLTFAQWNCNMEYISLIRNKFALLDDYFENIFGVTLLHMLYFSLKGVHS